MVKPLALLAAVALLAGLLWLALPGEPPARPCERDTAGGIVRRLNCNP